MSGSSDRSLATLNQSIRSEKTGPEKIAILAKSLVGNASYTITVRDLLWWFSAQRRGSNVNDWIRYTLTRSGLTTAPDFETSYIDGEVQIQRIVTGSDTPSSIDGGTETQSAPGADPVFRLRMLSSANQTLVSVKPNTSVREAITIMMSTGYSQLPVMSGPRDVKGMFSWDSYGSRVAVGATPSEVRECMDVANVLPADAPLFSALSDLISKAYVLVEDPSGAIAGIVTSSDIGLLFKQLAEPFLLLSEIENQVRRIISHRGKFSKQQLQAAVDPDGARKIDRISDLSFGEYIRMIENPENWERLGIQIDRKTFVVELDLVRRIRNDVMHFNPDPLDPRDLARLRDFSSFLQRLEQVLPQGKESTT